MKNYLKNIFIHRITIKTTRLFIDDLNTLLRQYKLDNILDTFDKDKLIHEVITLYIERIESFRYFSRFTFNIPFKIEEHSWDEVLLFMVTQLAMTETCHKYDVNIYKDTVFVKEIFYSYLGFRKFTCGNCGEISYLKLNTKPSSMSYYLISPQCLHCKRSTGKQTESDNKAFNTDKMYNFFHYFLESALQPIAWLFK